MSELRTRPLLVGREIGATIELADRLGAELVPVPPEPSAPPDLSGSWCSDWTGTLGEWGRGLRDGAAVPEVVVCAWSDVASPAPFTRRGPEEWAMLVEYELGLWFEASVAAARRCSDGGSMVIVAERPAALDSPGHSETVTVAEGLATLARSLGINEGDRGVRVNQVVTELFTAPDTLLGLAPLLESFPGTIGNEIAGAVRMLWSSDASGVTGTVLRADCGRSW